MPRPKVHDSQRQRAAEACSFCRESKKKCSGKAPCTQCQRRGLEQECTITYLPRGYRSRNEHPAARAGRQSWGSLPQIAADSMNDTFTAALPSPSNVTGPRLDNNTTDAGDDQLFRPLSPCESREENDDNTARGPGSAATVQANAKASSKDSLAPRMLLSSHGERVYIGATASIAFLQTVRRVVAEQIGPSDFSHSKENERMLEVEMSQSTDDAMETTVDQKLQFLRCYFSVTQAFIDIFDPPELEACIMNSGSGPMIATTTDMNPFQQATSPTAHLSPLRRASLDLVVAIGAQCTSQQDSQNVGRIFFRGAQRQALAEMLQDPDIEMVRVYLLMAFYMLGECRRNTAYMYLSVAARAAIALGLHSPSSYSGKQPLDANDKLRLRIWMTCRVGDKLVNSILGRPATTIGITEELGPIVNNLVSGSDHGLNCMVAAYGIVSIIDDINTKLYNEQGARPALVEQLLQAIDTWKREFTPSLEQTTTEGQLAPGMMGAKNSSVGVVHVSCLYYFAVMLATRPILISTLTLQQKQKDKSPMAEACLDAAMFLAQTCVEALEGGLLESNMCIMKALVFAAGLVLGLERFANTGINHEVERAFEGSKQVLGWLAARSPQASHYLDILTSLSNAISEQRSRLEPNRSGRYVSRLFSFGSSASNPGTQGDRSQDNASWTSTLLDDAAMAAMADLPAISDSPTDWPNVAQIDPELLIDWETVNISHWDNFPFRV